jgi:hypothetical protein
MSNNYKQTSTYRKTPVQGAELGPYVPPIVVDFTKTTQMQLKQQYNRRPDKLAYDLYGDAKLWWIFALYNRNNIQDPIHDFITGLTILIPNKDYVAGL